MNQKPKIRDGGFGMSYYTSNGITIAEHTSNGLRIRVDRIPQDELLGFSEWLMQVSGGTK
jgi:hypothetical protein